MSPQEQGTLAFKEGKLNNPFHYKFKFKQHRDWQLGFNKAYFKNLKKVKQNERDKARKRSQSL